MGWTVVDENRSPATGWSAAVLRPAVVRPAAIIIAVSVVIFALTALLTTDNKAQALTGHPEVLRKGCTWDSSGNYVQNCKVYSKSQGKDVIVQIRASSGSTQGVYLLDGMRAREDRSAWTTDVQAAKVYDGKSDTTLVMPVGGASSFYTDWNGGAGDKNTTIKQETFLTSELPDFLQQNFGVAKSGNAIVGLSMSAGPAVTLAEKHPEQFKVVQAMSGYYQINNPIGALGVFATQSLVSNYTNGIVNMWGPPGSAQWQQNDASQNLAKLRENGQVLIISSGNAFLSPQEMAKLKPEDQISAILLEALSAVSTVLMQLQAAQAGVSVINIANYGGHTWDNWGRGLLDGEQGLLDAMKATPPVTTKTMVLAANKIRVAEPSADATSSTASTSATESGAPSSSGSPSSDEPSASPSESVPSTSQTPSSTSDAQSTDVSASTTDSSNPSSGAASIADTDPDPDSAVTSSDVPCPTPQTVPAQMAVATCVPVS